MSNLGWGDTTLLVELGLDATGSPTHFELRAAVQPEFIEPLQSEFAAFEGAVLLDAVPDADRVPHFDIVLDAHALHRIAPPYVD